MFMDGVEAWMEGMEGRLTVVADSTRPSYCFARGLVELGAAGGADDQVVGGGEIDVWV